MNKNFMVSVISLILLLLVNYLMWAFCTPTALLAQLIIVLYFAICIYPLMKIQETWPLLIFIIFGLFVTICTGTEAWDARSIWLFHAKRIFFDGGLYAQLEEYAPIHNDYPVLFPAFAATLAKAVGHWNEALPKSAAIFLLIPPLLVILRAFANPMLFLLFTMGLIKICKDFLFNGYIDAILAIYTCALIFLLIPGVFEILESPKKNKIIYSILVFLFLTVLPLLKNEGLVILLCISVASLLFNSSLSKKIYTLSLSVALLFFFFSWKLPLIDAQMRNDLAIPGTLTRILKRLGDFDSFYLIISSLTHDVWICLMIMLTAVFISKKSSSKIKIPAVFLLLYLSALLAVYFSTPYDLSWHLGTSLDRTLMTINVVMFGMAILLIKKFRP